MRRARRSLLCLAAWGCVPGLLGCSVLPLHLTVASKPVEAGPVGVAVASEVTVTELRVRFAVEVVNRSQRFLVLNVKELELRAGPRRVSLEKYTADDDGDGPEQVVVEPGGVRHVELSALVQPLAPMTLHFGHAAVLGNEGALELEPLAVVGPTAPITASRPSYVELGVRASGGLFIGASASGPLDPATTRVVGASGILEFVLSILWKRLQLDLFLRGGNGRLVGLELGVRPFTGWLTFSGGFGAFFAQLGADSELSGQGRFGFGAWGTAEVAFDAAGGPFGLTWPRRFGVFLSGGPAWLAPGDRPLVLVGNVEAGLRWRFL